MTRVFTSGDVTLKLDGALARFAESLLKSAETSTVREMRELAGEVRDTARREWYGPRGVMRRTGKSGDIEVVEKVDLTSGSVTFAVGSTDERTSGGKPVPVFVRTPGPLSMVKVQVTHAEYWAAHPSQRANYYPIPGRDPRGSTGPFVWREHPKRGNRKALLTTLVKTPTKKAMRKLAEDIGMGVKRGN